MQTSLRLGVLAALAFSPAVHAQLDRGSFLVGTYGWNSGWVVQNGQNSVQVLDPYTGNSTTLTIRGRPANETVGAFLIENAKSFLMATKKLTRPAAGSVYRVRHVAATTWQATRLHTNALPINANTLVRIGGLLYVGGTAQFGNGLGLYDAHVYKLPVGGGNAIKHLTLGQTVGNVKTGAQGVLASMTAVGATLHCFTFIGAKTTVPSEHWTISTGTTPVRRKIANLPSTNRNGGTARSWASQSSFYDPIVKAIAVPSRWGEILWTTPTGKIVRRAALSGTFNGKNLNDAWPGGAAFNADTGAITLGDYRHGLDDYRCPGHPYTRDYARVVPPMAGITAIGALAHVASDQRAYFDGAGCADSSNRTPCTYVERLPRSPEPKFAVRLASVATPNPKLAVLVLGSRSKDIALGATGCTWRVSPGILLAAPATNGLTRWPIAIPAKFRAQFAMQAFYYDRAANSWGLVASDTRRLVIQ